MSKILSFLFTGLILLAVSLTGCAVVSSQPRPTPRVGVPAPETIDFSCNGSAHVQAIRLWEQTARPYITHQIHDGLVKNGDVYVLYYTQEEMQPFVEMTRRCNDRQQIDELATTLNPAFSALRPLPDDPANLGWVCTGGNTCTATNKLLGNEVPLCSMQFLGLIGAVATNIEENVPVAQRTSAEKLFLVSAASAMASQVNRWLSPEYSSNVDYRLDLTIANVTDGSSKYFYLDRDLWLLTALSDLAELQQADVGMDPTGITSLRQLQSKRVLIAKMFTLFMKRTTIESGIYGPRATLDKGYWRHYEDFKYASYNAVLSPVTCHTDEHGTMVKALRIQSTPSYIDPDASWDISHARRLVPALDTFVRNRINIKKAFGFSSNAFDPPMLQRSFASQIVGKVWNKDRTHPLFTNFWDGQNGWYRVGYDNGTGECRPGQPPYDLTWSFPTGGYPQWGQFDSTIQAIGRQLYLLIGNASESQFVNRYYPELAPTSAHQEAREVWMLAFVSSLVGT